MSLPPEKWADVQTTIAPIQEPEQRDLFGLMVAMVWGSRNAGVRERFRLPFSPSIVERHEYRTADGWTIPLLRCPPQPGAPGEPILLASSAHLSPKSMDAYEDRSLVRALHRAGYDVFLFDHRGSSDAQQPQGICTFDFDDMVQHDVPAAIDFVKRLSGSQRVCWIGHGLGGQLLVGHLASRTDKSIAAGVTLGAPVKFERLGTTARRAAAVAQSLPCHWKLPLASVQRLLTVSSKAPDLSSFGLRLSGPKGRGIMMGCGADIAMGLTQQIATWHEVGQLVSRDNRFDYLEGLHGIDSPLLVVGAAGDRFCQPDATELIANQAGAKNRTFWTLDSTWGHLDLIAGDDASVSLFPKLIDWLDEYRAKCWTSE